MLTKSSDTGAESKVRGLSLLKHVFLGGGGSNFLSNQPEIGSQLTGLGFAKNLADRPGFCRCWSRAWAVHGPSCGQSQPGPWGAGQGQARGVGSGEGERWSVFSRAVAGGICSSLALGSRACGWYGVCAGWMTETVLSQRHCDIQDCGLIVGRGGSSRRTGGTSGGMMRRGAG
jgi:hypothetical protein